MANCADNSYIIYYTNLDKGTIQIQKSELNTTGFDIALIGKIRLEYGEVFNENIVHLLEHFAAPALPSQDKPDTSKTYNALLSHPTPGQIWYNKTKNRPFVYGSDGVWRTFGDINDVAGNSGVMMHGQTLPIPATQDGYNFAPSECVWSVSPFNVPEEIDFLHCFTDPDGKIISQYRLEGQVGLTDAFANYQIVGIKGNVNIGTIDCQSGPAPTTTPLPSITPTPMPTATISPTPSITPSVTVTITPDVTPSITPTMTPSLSVSATPSPTPQSTPSATVTPTISVTPSVSLTPSVTPTISLTPSVTPSTAFNNGDVFAVGFRPFTTEPTAAMESMYVRKMGMDNGDLNQTFTQTANYFPMPSDSLGLPTFSNRGAMLRDWYVNVAIPNVYAYGVNLGVGVYPISGLSFDGQDFLPQALTTDTIYMYLGSIDTTDPQNTVSKITPYTFDGAYFTSIPKTVSLPNQYIAQMFTLDDNLILVTTHVVSAGVQTGTIFNVFLNSSTGLENQGVPYSFPDVLESIAVLDSNNIAVIDTNNVLTRLRYTTTDGLEVLSTLDLSSLATTPINAIQYDKRSTDLYVMYQPSLTTTGFARIITTDPVNYVLGTTRVFVLVAEQELNTSLDVFEDRLLYLNITNNDKRLNIVSYKEGAFSLTGSVTQNPQDRDVQSVAFIVPNLAPRPSMTPTPSLTPSITPSSSVTPSTTPPVTPSSTPASTPPNTPPSTPPQTPTQTPAASSGPSDPCGGAGCDSLEPNCGCPVGCFPIQGGCRCGEFDEVCA